MMKIIFLLKRKPGITPEQFRDHYENSHVVLAKKYIGHLLVDYKRKYPTFTVKGPTDYPPGSAPDNFDFGYDAITEMVVDNQAAIDEIGRIFNDPKVNPILVEDEGRFLDRSATLMITVDEADTGTKLAACDRRGRAPTFRRHSSGETTDGGGPS